MLQTKVKILSLLTSVLIQTYAVIFFCETLFRHFFNSSVNTAVKLKKKTETHFEKSHKVPYDVYFTVYAEPFRTLCEEQTEM